MADKRGRPAHFAARERGLANQANHGYGMHPHAVKITRRQFCKLGGSGFIASLGGIGYGTLIEPQRLSLERVTMRLPRLPSALEGFKIAVLSDFHLHPFTKIGQIVEAVRLANDSRPDLTVLLGDYVDATVAAIDELAPALARLNARCGVLAVLGNHDHWKGAKIVCRALEKCGIAVLRNAGTSIRADGGELFVAGVESAWAGHPNLTSALAQRRGDTPVILLAHEPDYADTAARDGRIAFQLSGHSHGGQVRLPLIGALRLPSWGKRYDHGLYRVRDMQLYTNRGIGLVGIPVRFNCMPEVTEVTLAAA